MIKIVEHLIFANCPNHETGQVTANVINAGNIPAQADQQKAIDAALAQIDAMLEKQVDCGQFTCPDGTCEYDSRIIGTPEFKAIPAGRTHKHHHQIAAKYQITMTVEYGCWCEKTI
jgi:hypothetical protein